MRILTVVKDLGIGGTQRSAQNFSIGYKNIGFESAVFVVKPGGVREEILNGEDIKVFKPIENHDFFHVVKEIKSWNPDLIHFHRAGIRSNASGQLLRMFKEDIKCPVVETNHFGKPDYSSDNKLIDIHFQLAKWSLWKWSHWIDAQKNGDISVVVPHIVDNRAFYPVGSSVKKEELRKRFNIPTNAFVFGRVAQPSLPKWSPIIFRAFKKIVSSYDNAYLLLVGLPARLKDELLKLPIEVRNHIITLPTVSTDSELRDYYNTLDIFLHASDIGESFGLVLTEAMLCGVPVITLSTPTKDNSQLEVVGHNRGGLVVTDCESMIQAMEKLLLDHDLRKTLGVKGRSWVTEEYSSQKVIERIQLIINIILTRTDRNYLRRELASQKELISRVDDKEIYELLKHTLGKTSFSQRSIMKIAHNPIFYKIFSNLKFSGKEAF